MLAAVLPERVREFPSFPVCRVIWPEIYSFSTKNGLNGVLQPHIAVTFGLKWHFSARYSAPQYVNACETAILTSNRAMTSRWKQTTHNPLVLPSECLKAVDTHRVAMGRPERQPRIIRETAVNTGQQTVED